MNFEIGHIKKGTDPVNYRCIIVWYQQAELIFLWSFSAFKYFDNFGSFHTLLQFFCLGPNPQFSSFPREQSRVKSNQILQTVLGYKGHWSKLLAK